MKDKEILSQIIIKADDDLNYIVELLKGSEGDVVIFKFPVDNDVINSPIGLKTLKKKSLDFGKALLIISPEAQYNELLNNAGIEIADSFDEVNEENIHNAKAEVEEHKMTLVGLNSQKKRNNATNPLIVVEKPEIINNNPVPEIFEPPVIYSGNSEVILNENEGDIENLRDKEVEKPSYQAKNTATGMTGVDFSKVTTKTEESFFSRIFRRKKNGESKEDFLPPITKYQVEKAKGTSYSVYLKLLGILIVAVLIFAGALFAVFYFYFPKVRIELKVASDKVTTFEQIVAKTSVTGFDSNKKEIPLIKETSEKTGSSNVTPTGNGVSGEKAKGTLNLIKLSGADVSLPVGTAVQTSNGLTFVTQVAVTVSQPVTVAIAATQFGEEYNVAASGEYNWVVTGHDTIKGQNFSAMIGGTKRTYKVLSKDDYDKAVEALKKELYEQLKSDLEFKNRDNGYTFVEQSLKSLVKDTPSINPVVGAETQTDAFLEMKTTSSALYYQTDSLQKLVEQLIKTKYESTILTTNQKGLTVSDLKIEVKSITVGQNEEVTFAVDASGLVTPQIDIDTIKSQIVGKKWDEMVVIAKQAVVQESDPRITFFPTWIPKELWYVPAETTRVDISVEIAE